MVLIFFPILFALKSQPHKFALVILLFLLVFALMNRYASCFPVCKQLWFTIEGGEDQRTTCNLWLVPLHYIPIVIYICFTWCHAWIAPWPPNPPTTTTTTNTLLFPPRLPVRPDAIAAAAPENPLFPPVVSRPADGGLGVKTAERQPDAGTECEGRRGRAPDLSEWGRPAREMYSLPLLYRNHSPYEF